MTAPILVEEKLDAALFRTIIDKAADRGFMFPRKSIFFLIVYIRDWLESIDIHISIRKVTMGIYSGRYQYEVRKDGRPVYLTSQYYLESKDAVRAAVHAILVDEHKSFWNAERKA